jgi:hypothetical protein
MINSMLLSLTGKTSQKTEQEWQAAYASFVTQGVASQWNDEQEELFREAYKSDMAGDEVHRFITENYPEIESDLKNALLAQCEKFNGRKTAKIPREELKKIARAWEQFKQEQIKLEIASNLDAKNDE